MRKILKNNFIKMILIIMGAICIGYLALVLAYMIPLDKIRENLLESYPLLETEGTWRKLIGDNQDTLLDNWTDSTILIETGYEYTQNAVQAALLVPECSVVDNNPTDTFIKLYRQDSDLEINEWYYVNYWHGYLIFMKPLMTFLNYGQIRYLNQFIQTALIGTILMLLGYRKKILYGIPIILTYIFLNPAVVSMSIQYNTMFMITFLQLLIILVKQDNYDDRKLWIYHFLMVGCFTSYFDFLTYPIIGYGIPFIMLISLYPSKLKDDIISFVKTGIAWCFGYIGMWAGKWILGTILTDQNVIQQAIDRIKYRSRGDAEEYSYIDILKLNLGLRKDILIIAVCFMVICIIYVVIKKTKINWSSLVMYLLISVIPFAWYYVAANHSYIHSFFTYRDMAIVVMAVMFIGIRLLEKSMQNK